MKIALKKEGGVLTAAVEGRIDTVTAPQFEQEMTEALKNADELILDLAATEYISSVGLRVLLTLYKLTQPKSGMKLIHVSPFMMDIFEVTGLTDIMTIEP